MEPLPKTGIKIERPSVEPKINIIFVILALLSLLLILGVMYIFFLEGTGRSLPTFLKLPLE